MNAIRVLLADDHTLFRAGIRALLERLSEVRVVGEAATGREVLQFLAGHPVDVVLMDILMPELNGLDATARVCATFPDTRVIILSMNSASEYVVQAIRAGAAGYLLKSAIPGELELAIKAVTRGERFLNASIAGSIAQADVAGLDIGTDPLTCLTIRQREVLQLVAEGFRTKEIAKKLELSIKTVETHRSQIMDALDVHDIAGLVRFAIRTGLTTADA